MHGFPKNKPRQLEPITEPPEDGEASVNRGGRPLGSGYEPREGERKAVWVAAACGVPQDEISRHLNDGKGISKHTLEKHFRKELNEGMWEANLTAAGGLLDTIKNCPDLKVRQRATEFWLERRMGFESTVNQKHSGPGGGPVCLTSMTPEEFEERARRIARQVTSGEFGNDEEQ